MKLINRAMALSFQIEKIGPYALQEDLQLKEKEQTIRWEISTQIIEAVLLGKPKIEMIQQTKEGDDLLNDSLLLIKVNGEPAYGPIRILGDHGRMSSQEGIHCWLDADLEDGSKRGIFITNKDVLEVTVLSPWVIAAGHILPKIHVTIEADLCRTIREEAFKL